LASSRIPAPTRAAPAWRRHRTAIGSGFAAVVLIALIVGLIVAQGAGAALARTLTQPDGGPSYEAAFSRNGATLVTGGSSAYVWNTASGRAATTLAAASAGSFNGDAMALSPDGKTLATNDEAAQVPAVTLWDLATGSAANFTPTLPIIGDPMAFSPDGAVLALGDDDGRVDLWSVTGKRLIATLSDGSPASPVTALAFSPGGRTIAAARQNGSTRLWNLATGRPLRIFTAGKLAGQPDSVAFSPDGTMVAIGDAGGGATVWDTSGGKPAAVLGAPGGGNGGIAGVTDVAFSPDGSIIAIGDAAGGDTSVWNVKTKRRVATVNDPGGTAILAVAFSPDGTTLNAADADGSTYVWDTSLWQPPVTPKGK
jgi:WD40 repeat protein